MKLESNDITLNEREREQEEKDLRKPPKAFLMTLKN